MLLGGIMGLIKGLIQNMSWFGFRHLLGFGGTFENTTMPLYAVIYGAIMAVLEITSSILLLMKKRIGFYFAIITLSVNAFGCIIAIVFGDLLAIGSLLTRVFALYILFQAKKLNLQ